MKGSIGILTGSTATGKSDIALEFANRHGDVEIINADSLLVYKDMNIGTAKPTASELNQIPHHLIDIRTPHESFTAGEYYRSAHQAINEIQDRNKRALIVGGTGFYLKTLLFGIWNTPPTDPGIRDELKNSPNHVLYEKLHQLDPTSACRIGQKDQYRLIRALEIIELTGKTPTELQSKVQKHPDPRFHLWVIDRPNPDLDHRIAQRTQRMITNGLIDEFRFLQTHYPKSRALAAIGYAQVANYLTDQKPLGRKIKPGIEGLQQEIQLATRQLVKSQRTWFRNQTQHVPQSQWFLLDRDRTQLEKTMDSVYQCCH